MDSNETSYPHPCDGLPRKSYAGQTVILSELEAKKASTLLCDWMEEKKLSYTAAAKILCVGPHLIVAVMNGAQLHRGITLKMSLEIPGMKELV